MNTRQSGVRLMGCLVAAGLLLTACGQAAAAPTATDRPPRATATTSPAPTATAEPLPTDIPTAAPTVMVTIRSVVRPSEMEGARLYTAGHLSNWRFFFAVETAQPIQGSYEAVVDRNKHYTCSVMTAAANRLYCIGPTVAYGEWFTFEIQEQSSGRIVFTGKLYAPKF